MIWSKMKQLLEKSLCPELKDRVGYSNTSYRYLPDKAGTCYITVDKKNILNMADAAGPIQWYKTEQEIKKDPDIQLPVRREDVEAVRASAKGPIPEERLMAIAQDRKASQVAKELLLAQTALSKSNFYEAANRFLSAPIEESLESEHILLNVLALLDKRVGKKRLLSMADRISQKHPIVRYFYRLRLGLC
jgi:hypothetical protein